MSNSTNLDSDCDSDGDIEMTGMSNIDRRSTELYPPINSSSSSDNNRGTLKVLISSNEVKCCKTCTKSFWTYMTSEEKSRFSGKIKKKMKKDRKPSCVGSDVCRGCMKAIRLKRANAARPAKRKASSEGIDGTKQPPRKFKPPPRTLSDKHEKQDDNKKDDEKTRDKNMCLHQYILFLLNNSKRCICQPLSRLIIHSLHSYLSYNLLF